MADALISLPVGGTMWAFTTGLTAYSVHKLQHDPIEQKIPLMGVLGAFVFAMQMINFAIPGTGSSGHVGGALLLAILLGPYAAFLTIVSILVIQALFFADGGLLAFGCNAFNLGFFNCFVAYLWIYKPLCGKTTASPRRMLIAALLAAIIGMQLTAFSVVMETIISGISNLPFTVFVLLMQPIHLVIGIAEGFITAAVIGFIRNSRPDILERTGTLAPFHGMPLRRLILILLTITLFTGGVLTWFASTHPEGLEWAIVQSAGKPAHRSQDALHHYLAELQHQTAFLENGLVKPSVVKVEPQPVHWPDINTGTSLSGILGALFTLMLTIFLGLGLRWFKKRKAKEVK